MKVQFTTILYAWLAVGAAVLGGEPTRTIVFFGDSLTEGYGLDDPSADAYPAVIQRKLDASHLPWRAINAGLSGETTSGGLRRVDWILRQQVDVFVLALGSNDGLRGVEPAVTQANLQAIIDRVRATRPAAKIVLAGMQLPPTMGDDYTRSFALIYPVLAARNRLPFIPFLLAGVGGHAELNQPDGMHPSAEGAVKVAENVWKILYPLLSVPPIGAPRARGARADPAWGSFLGNGCCRRRQTPFAPKTLS